jgi:hypothetical protein
MAPVTFEIRQNPLARQPDDSLTGGRWYVQLRAENGTRIMWSETVATQEEAEKLVALASQGHYGMAHFPAEEPPLWPRDGEGNPLSGPRRGLLVP